MAEATDLLKSMDATLKQILAILQAHVPKEIASDRDLDGPYGNPKINSSDPKDWHGPAMKGRKLSECPAEYLEIYAERCDYFERKALAENKTTQAGKPVAPYLHADAARARGWAKRIREGKVAAPAAQSAAPTFDEPAEGFGDVADF